MNLSVYSSLVKDPSFYSVFTSSQYMKNIYIYPNIKIKHTIRLFLVNGSCTENKMKMLEKRERKLFHLWAYGVCYILGMCSHCNQNTNNTSRLNLKDPNPYFRFQRIATQFQFQKYSNLSPQIKLLLSL